MRRALPLLLLAACAHAKPAPTQPVRLWLAGDVNLGAGQGALEPLKPLVASLGAGVVNLEGPVADAQPSQPSKRTLFNAPSALPQLAALGVRVAGIANNHAHDSGPDGPQRTSERLAQAGIEPAGTAILELNGVRVAITAHDLEHGVPKDLAQDLAAARARADVLIATFHVTGPPTYLPRPELREAADIALAAGARVVAAHGTHAIGPVERRGNAVIAWGLGNVAFDCDCTDVPDALILAVEVGPGAPVDVAIYPIDAGLKGARARASADPNGIFDLLEAVGTPKLERHGAFAKLP